MFPAVVAAATLGWSAWFRWQAPSFIPYQAWAVPRDPDFPLARSEPDPAAVLLRKKDLLEADDFVFTMGVGGGWHGLDVFRVDAEGNASYIFTTHDGRLWKAEFQVPAPTLAKLRQLLVDVNYASLKRAYHADIFDGTQWCIRVDVAGATKKVYCNNYFPDEAVRLASAISQDVLPAHEEEIKSARRIFESTAERARAGLW